MTERVRRHLKNHQIKVATKPLRSVENMLPYLKDNINKFDQGGVVYKITSLDCTDVYVVKLVDHSKHDTKDVRPDVIAQLTNDDSKKNLH